MIRNLSKKTILADRFRLCASPLSKAIGLMFALKPEPLLMVFPRPTKVSLHMIFVFFPIDVLCLDESRKVIDLKKDFKPFHFFESPEMCKYMIELPIGRINKSRTVLGDLLSF